MPSLVPIEINRENISNAATRIADMTDRIIMIIKSVRSLNSDFDVEPKFNQSVFTIVEDTVSEWRDQFDDQGVP